MITVRREEIAALGRLERVAFATSLPGVKPVVLVGTMSAGGVSNLAPFSSVVHLGSNPVLLGLISRPDAVERHTLANIVATRVYTLNHVAPAMIEAAHQCSARYPAGVSEFRSCGFTEVFAEGFAAPGVGESPLRIGLELVEVVNIAANDTRLIIGSVAWVDFPEEARREDGSITPEAAGIVGSAALDTYLGVRTLARLAHAKADQPPRRI